MNHAVSLIALPAALALLTLPGRALADAGAEDAPAGDAAFDAGPARDAAPEPPPLPDGRLETFFECGWVPTPIGPPEAPARLALPIEAPWAGSISEVAVVVDLPSGDGFPVEHVYARVVGEPWVPFLTTVWSDVPFMGDCPEDSACDEYAVELYGKLPALGRVPAPFEIEFAREPDADPAFGEVCVRVTAYASATPGPLLWPASPSDPPAPDGEGDAFYDFWEDEQDAGGPDYPTGDDEARPGEGDPPGQDEPASAGEKAGCSTAAVARGPFGLIGLLLAAPFARRRLRGGVAGRILRRCLAL